MKIQNVFINLGSRDLGHIDYSRADNLFKEFVRNTTNRSPKESRVVSYPRIIFKRLLARATS